MAEDEDLAGLRSQLSALTTMNETGKQMTLAMHYVAKMREGALVTVVNPPTRVSQRVTASVRWGEYGEDEGGESRSRPNDREKGVVEYTHPSFSLYRRKKFLNQPQHRSQLPTAEDEVLFNIESNPTYENVHPGTITVEGLGMEAWGYEADTGSIRGNRYSHTSYLLPTLKDVPLRTLLRRFSELQHPEYTFGADPNADSSDLNEILGQDSLQTDSTIRNMEVYMLSTALAKSESGFADFTRSATIVSQRLPGAQLGLCKFLRQMILAKELVLRVQRDPNLTPQHFTIKTQAAINVQDLFFRNTRMCLVEGSPFADVTPAAPEQQAQAETLKIQGNEALGKKDYQEAVDLYTKAIDLDRSNATYHLNRSAAYAHAGKYEDAAQDAVFAIKLDPNYAKAWARLGAAALKQGMGKRARDAYQRAIDVAGKDAATGLMKQGLADANAKIEADVHAIYDNDRVRNRSLWKRFLAEDWELFDKTLVVKSTVLDQQGAALVDFAEQMKWPYMDEVPDTVQSVCRDFEARKHIGSLCLVDWLNGVLLPGKWTSFSLMTSLIHCTPSLSRHLQPAPYFECGLAIPGQASYWKTTSVLGRVLGCLSGVTSLCGWVGPCSPVQFVPPHPTEDSQEKPHHVRLLASRLPPVRFPDNTAAMEAGSVHQQYLAAYMTDNDEDKLAYLAELQDPNKWVSPESPAPLSSNGDAGGGPTGPVLHSVKLTAQPLPPTVTNQTDPAVIAKHTEYRASITFQLPANHSATYPLNTNPIFVTLPPCSAQKQQQEEQPSRHKLHVRELLPELDLRNPAHPQVQVYGHKNDDSAVAIVNTRGGGHAAELLARAWCSWGGKNALIARSDGPCYACAVRATRSPPIGLGVSVLIWAD